MVQFIREQTRQYAADQSGAIETAQLAQNVKEWGGVVQSVGSIAQSIEKQRQKELKLQEEADEQMINTQIGSKAQTELLKWNVAQIEAGVDPNTDEYTQKLYAKRDELYQPYLDKMTSEKGRNALQKQGLDTAERIRQSNIGKIAVNQKKAKAQLAFSDTVSNLANEAREFGKIGSWEEFNEATKKDRKAVSDYLKNNLDKDADQVEYAVDMQNLQNFLLGQTEAEPEEIVKVFGSKEDYQEIKRDEQKAKMSNPNAKDADKFADDVTDWQYRKEDIEKYSRQKRLDYLPKEAVKQVTDSFVREKKNEKLAVEQEMKGISKDSKHYESLKKKADEIQEQIDDPEKYVVDMMTENIRKAIVPIAKEQIGRNKLAEQQLKKDAEIHTYRAVLNPDTSVSLAAQMQLSLGRKPVEEMYQMSLPDEDIRKAYDAYAQAKVKTLTREYETIEGTDAMIDAYQKVLQHDPADQIGAIKEAFDGFVALHNAPVTQKQIDNYQNAMYAALSDGAFADLMRSFTSIKDIYTPDTSWFENAFGTISSSVIGESSPFGMISRALTGAAPKRDIPEGVRLVEQGLVSPNIMAQDIDTVEKYFKNKVVEITNNAGGMLALAATQTDPEARRMLGQKAVDYYVTEKRKAFDYAMQNFGIDMGKLREVYNTRGEAITQLGMRKVKYVGDDPSTGLPNFEPYIDEKAMNTAYDRIMNLIKLIAKAGTI